MLTLNLALDVALGSSLKFMWSMVNTLQIFVYFNKVKINLSVKAMIFLDKLRFIALGEFIPYDWLTSYFIEQWNVKIESIDKLGSMAFFIGGIICFTLIVLLVGRIIKKLGYSQKIIDSIKKRIFWNTFIRSSLQAYIKILFVYLTLASALEYSSFAECFKSIIVILIIFALLVLPNLYILIL